MYKGGVPEQFRASVAQTAVFAVCGSSYPNRFALLNPRAKMCDLGGGWKWNLPGSVSQYLVVV
jgi:hypothetical protein